jgi:hypothetical protein
VDWAEVVLGAQQLQLLQTLEVMEEKALMVAGAAGAAQDLT